MQPWVIEFVRNSGRFYLDAGYDPTESPYKHNGRWVYRPIEPPDLTEAFNAAFNALGDKMMREVFDYDRYLASPWWCGAESGYKWKVSDWIDQDTAWALKLMPDEDWPGLRAIAKDRDATCVACGTSKALNCHHRCYKTLGCIAEIGELTTLCQRDHFVIHRYGRGPGNIRNRSQL